MCVDRLSHGGFPGCLLWFLIRVALHNVLFWIGKKVFSFFFCVCFAGTLYAACELMKKQQAEVLGCMVVIELKELNGRDKLKPHNVFSLVQYWGRLQPPRCSYAGRSGALRVTAANKKSLLSLSSNMEYWPGKSLRSSQRSEVNVRKEKNKTN